MGVICVKENQFTEEQILGNTEHTPQFSEFLTLLGDKVRLKGSENTFFFILQPEIYILKIKS